MCCAWHAVLAGFLEELMAVPLCCLEHATPCSGEHWPAHVQSVHTSTAARAPWQLMQPATATLPYQKGQAPPPGGRPLALWPIRCAERHAALGRRQRQLPSAAAGPCVPWPAPWAATLEHPHATLCTSAAPFCITLLPIRSPPLPCCAAAGRPAVCVTLTLCNPSASSLVTLFECS